MLCYENKFRSINCKKCSLQQKNTFKSINITNDNEKPFRINDMQKSTRKPNQNSKQSTLFRTFSSWFAHFCVVLDQNYWPKCNKGHHKKSLQSFYRNIVNFDIDTACAFNVRNNISRHLFGNKIVIYVDFDGKPFKIFMVDMGGILDVVLPIGSSKRQKDLLCEFYSIDSILEAGQMWIFRKRFLAHCVGYFNPH